MTDFDFDTFAANLDAFVERHKERVALKGIKTLLSNSEETICFNATLYVDGKKRGSVRNSGRGGPHEYDDWKAVRALSDDLKASEAAEGREPLHEAVDALVDAHVSDHLLRQDAMKWRRAGKVAFQLPGQQEGEWHMVKWPAVARDWPRSKPNFVQQAVKKGWFDGCKPEAVRFAADLI